MSEETPAMMHPSTELRFISEAIGFGVFATKRIPRGTITWAQCALDRVLPPAEVAAMGAAYRPTIDRYAYRNGRGDYVLCWDLARFMNHSCDPAVLSPGFDLDIAVRDVLPGEELTCEYALLNLEDEMPCMCGAPACRERLTPSDARRFLDSFDGRVRTAFGDVAHVPQPLAPFVRDYDAVMSASRGDRPVPSCAVHFLGG
jgi:hypothetical protein